MKALGKIERSNPEFKIRAREILTQMMMDEEAVSGPRRHEILGRILLKIHGSQTLINEYETQYE